MGLIFLVVTEVETEGEELKAMALEVETDLAPREQSKLGEMEDIVVGVVLFLSMILIVVETRVVEGEMVAVVLISRVEAVGLEVEDLYEFH